MYSTRGLRPRPLCVVILLWCALVEADNSRCVTSCNLKNPGEALSFCADDFTTQWATTRACTSQCITSCNVTPLYVGPCGCPNRCSDHLGFGSCRPLGNDTATCHCLAGWGGADCSVVVCPANNCSHHGRCVISHAPEEAHYCACEAGYTGPYCSEAEFAGTQAPYGTILPDPAGGGGGFAPSPYADDAYGDAHPIFNLSRVAQIHFAMPWTDVARMVNAYNVYLPGYYQASMTFYNGAVRETRRVGVKVKGWVSKGNAKKGFNVKIAKGERALFGLRKFGMKCGQGGADALIKPAMFGVMARALAAPVARTSFAWVYMNNVSYGVYYIEEKVNTVEFLQSRFGTQTGTLMKLGAGVNLQYLGANESDYASQRVQRATGYLERYDVALGSNMTPFIELLWYMNVGPNDVLFAERAVRTLAVEDFTFSYDHFSAGNNYLLFDVAGRGRWALFEHDFDTVFFDVSASVSRDIFQFAFQFTTSYIAGT